MIKNANTFFVSNPNRNPYLNVVEKNESTGYDEFEEARKPYPVIQNAPIVYDMNSIILLVQKIFFGY